MFGTSTTSSPRRRLRFLAMLTCMVGLATAASGCNWIILAGYLIGGPPSIEPDFDAMTGKSMSDKEITVAVVCYAPTELKWDFEDVDHELAKYVTFRLVEHKIQVVNPDQVRAWLDEHPDWDQPQEIGQAFEVDYVIYIDLAKYSLYEENSAHLYRGSAEAIVSVVEMDDSGDGEQTYNKEVLSKYPIHQPISTSEVTFWNFKRSYLSRLSEEIGRLFYEHYAGDDIPDGA